MKTSLLLFLLLCSVSIVSAQQRKVCLEIISNDPVPSEKLSVHFSPVGIVMSNYLSVLFGAGAAYNHENIFGVEVDIRSSYHRKINAKLNDFNDYKRRSSHIEPVTSTRNLSLIELKGHYLIGKHIRMSKVRVILKDVGHGVFYTKVPAKRFIAFPIRIGYKFHQTVFNSNSAFSGDLLPFNGVEIGNAEATPIEVYGFTNFGAHMINLGFGLYIRDGVTIEVSNHLAQFEGIKKNTDFFLWYVDIMVPIKQSLEDVHFFERTYSSNSQLLIKSTKFNLNDYTPTTAYGFRTGWYFGNFGLPSGFGSMWVEFGCRPGPIDMRSNLYLIGGIGIGFTKNPF